MQEEAYSIASKSRETLNKSSDSVIEKRSKYVLDLQRIFIRKHSLPRDFKIRVWTNTRDHVETLSAGSDE
jgi:hypothetical protein